MSNKNKIIIAIILVAIAVFAFVYLRNSSNTDTGTSLVAEKKIADFSDAKEILALLKKMDDIELNDAIFNSKAFIGLKDTTVVLVEQPMGRNNPFASLGTDGIRIATTTVINVGR